jgi:hypothetical protein
MTLKRAPNSFASASAAAARSAGPRSLAGVLTRSRTSVVALAARSTAARSAACGQTSLAETRSGPL